MEIDINHLKKQAISVSKKAYSPYSNFAVGCLIVSGKGNIYSGCNVENISFGLTNCAERTAIFKGVSEEGRDFKIKQVVIYTPTKMPITPCGACRQVLREFGDDFKVISFCDGKDEIITDIDYLLPRSPDIRIG